MKLALAPRGFTRRSFLQVLGASGLSACFRPPAGRIVPYVRNPPGEVPGRPLHYATALALDGFALGVVATCYEGRPVKIEGNPLHPESLGASRLFEQASLAGLYDPGRAKEVLFRGRPSAMPGFLAAVKERARIEGERRGAGLCFLLEPSASPAIGALRARLAQEYPDCRLRSWSALPLDSAYEGARIAFGRPLEARIEPKKAKVIVALDADFVSLGVREARELADRRVPGPEMARVYVAEGLLTPTGVMADHRLAVRTSEVGLLARALAAEVAKRTPGAPQGIAAPTAAVPEASLRWARAAAIDLARAGGEGLVTAGRRQPAGIHALVHGINALLGNLGKTVTLREPLRHDAEAGLSMLARTADEMEKGAIQTLVIGAYNPCLGAPADFELPAKLLQVPFSAYLAARDDETARGAGWVLPAAHPLETWGDGRSSDGTASIVQPLLAPLFGGISEIELLAAFLGDDRPAREIVRESWQAREGRSDFELFWEQSLQAGVVEGTAVSPVAAPPRWDDILAAAAGIRGPVAGVELDLAGDLKVLDGRFAGNPWLQELSDPATRQTWGNAAIVGPATAAKLGVRTSQVVRLSAGPREIAVPAIVLPGTAEGAICLALGYGGIERPASEPVGANGYLLRSPREAWVVAGVRVAPTAAEDPVALTQEYSRLLGSGVAKSLTVAALASLGGRPIEEPEPPLSAYRPYAYPGPRWGMAIDLARCTGCSACVMACASENNTPVVGKDEVIRGREMHWIRIDRWLTGPPDAPRAQVAPLACVQCEDAPCEYVCPVNATVHSDEGLNEMVYNRCVGTRYCSNNCPYKVRRFNFLDWGYEKGPLRTMQQNPEVTVRSRGVMEKCTYCVQRIERARIDARVAGQPLRGSAIETACQQACPTRAIVFGDLAEKDSEVARLHDDRRAYRMLNELGTRPRTSHLARVFNPSAEI